MRLNVLTKNEGEDKAYEAYYEVFWHWRGHFMGIWTFI